MIKRERFRFRSFQEFEVVLYDIIGHMKVINGQSLHERLVLDGVYGGIIPTYSQKSDQIRLHINNMDMSLTISRFNWQSQILRGPLINAAFGTRLLMSSTQVPLEEKKIQSWP